MTVADTGCIPHLLRAKKLAAFLFIHATRLKKSVHLFDDWTLFVPKLNTLNISLWYYRHKYFLIMFFACKANTSWLLVQLNFRVKNVPRYLYHDTTSNSLPLYVHFSFVLCFNLSGTLWSWLWLRKCWSSPFLREYHLLHSSEFAIQLQFRLSCINRLQISKQIYQVCHLYGRFQNRIFVSSGLLSCL